EQYVIISTPNNAILLGDVQTGKILHELRGHGPSQLWALAISADGQLLLSGGDDGQVVLWNLGTRQIVQRFPCHERAIKRLPFTSKRRIVSASDDNTVRTWDTTSGAEVAQFAIAADGRTINATAFSGDGRWFVYGRSNGKLKVHEVATGKVRHRLQAHDEAVT